MSMRLEQISNQTTPYPIPVKNTSLLNKVWNAVVDFFKIIARKIKECSIYILEKLETLAVSIGLKTPSMPRSLKAKIDSYKNMPKSDVLFLEKSIKLMREVIREKTPESVEEFDDNVSAFLNPDVIVLAAIKAYIISDKDCFFPSFLNKVTENNQKPRSLFLVFLTKKYNNQENSSNLIKDLKEEFLDLSYADQEAIIQLTNFDSTYLKNNETQDFVKTLGYICGEMIRENPNLYEAYQSLENDSDFY